MRALACRAVGAALLLVVSLSANEARSGTLVPDSDCPGFVCTLSPNGPTNVRLDVLWQPDTNNLGFVDIFLEWNASENDPDGAILGGDIGSNPFVPNAFSIFVTGVDPLVPHTASVRISYSSQLRPQNDPQASSCLTSGLCVDLFGADTYTVQVEAVPEPSAAVFWDWLA